jgi:hypothetical protein
LTDRPTGVTILAILQLLGSLGLLVLGSLALLAGIVLLWIPVLGIVFVAVAAFMLIFGIIGFFLFWGLWGMKSWAYIWTMIFNIFSIIISIAQIVLLGDFTVLFSIAISLIIVIYLYTVRDAFK